MSAFRMLQFGLVVAVMGAGAMGYAARTLDGATEMHKRSLANHEICESMVHECREMRTECRRSQ